MKIYAYKKMCVGLIFGSIMSIAQNLEAIRRQLPAGVRLVAVSKTHPVEALMQAYDAGQRVFGENKVQEMRQKQQAMPADVEWHMIGHLQTNKVRQVVPFVVAIHSVDSQRLLETINAEAQKCGRVVDCLLQLHIAQESTKFGFTDAELRDMLATGVLAQLQYVRVVGLMGMASLTDNREQILAEFQHLRSMFDELRHTHFAGAEHFCELSMGMSHDFPIAVEAGSTMVRVGSLIFGQRDYGQR